MMTEQLRNQINSIDLNPIKARLIEKRSWSPQRANNAIEKYREFLYHAVVHKTVEPSVEVDEVWHDHILHTRKYAADCERIAGRFIHHQPHVIGVGAENLEVSINATCESSRATCESSKATCESAD